MILADEDARALCEFWVQMDEHYQTTACIKETMDDEKESRLVPIFPDRQHLERMLKATMERWQSTVWEAASANLNQDIANRGKHQNNQVRFRVWKSESIPEKSTFSRQSTRPRRRKQSFYDVPTVMGQEKRIKVEDYPDFDPERWRDLLEKYHFRHQEHSPRYQTRLWSVLQTHLPLEPNSSDESSSFMIIMNDEEFSSLCVSSLPNAQCPHWNCARRAFGCIASA